ELDRILHLEHLLLRFAVLVRPLQGDLVPSLVHSCNGRLNGILGWRSLVSLVLGILCDSRDGQAQHHGEGAQRESKHVSLLMKRASDFHPRGPRDLCPSCCKRKANSADASLFRRERTAHGANPAARTSS